MSKKLNITTVLLILAAFMYLQGMVSCNPDPITKKRIVPGDSVVSLDIGTIKSFYHGGGVPIDEDNNFTEINIYGSLVSDPEVENTPEGCLILQEGNQGIALFLEDSTDTKEYKLNEILKVNVRRGTLQKKNGNLAITGLSPSDIIRTGEIDSIIPTTVSLKSLVNNFDQYNGTIVEVQLVDLVPAPSPGDTYEGDWGLDDGTIAPGSISLHSFSGSKFEDQLISVNSSLTLVGIPMYNKNDKDSLEMQMWLRNEISGDKTGIIPSNSPFVISGFLANPTGWDQIEPGVGYFPSYLDRPVEGGFQYVQFMALEDIDFSETPFSMVLMLSTEGRPGATADGWTAGTFRTIKFDLTLGQAAQGSFFYVGSGEKLIDGFSPNGFSTDISDANWIRSTPWLIRSTDEGGWDDEIGEPFSNGNIGHGANSWLDHRTEAGSDAIAVFEGTTVTPTSVPVDAVFFNEQIGGSLDEDNGWGFLVPDNDLYSAVDPDDNTAQPLFGQGTNTYAVPIDIVNGNGVWVALGGIVNEKGFVEKRDKPKGIQLSVEPGESHLSDIEEGAGIIIFRR